MVCLFTSDGKANRGKGKPLTRHTKPMIPGSSYEWVSVCSINCSLPTCGIRGGSDFMGTRVERRLD